VRVKKSWKLVEISLTILYFSLVERIFENSLTKSSTKKIS